MPKYFYRYRSLYGKAEEYVRQSLVDAKIYFAPPSSFNDPFDCNPYFSFDGCTTKEIENYRNSLLLKYDLTSNRETRRRQSKEYAANFTSDPRRQENLAEFNEKYCRYVTQNIGLLCLSTIPDDLLMWSHYADSHRGVCFQFDGTDNVFSSAQKIKYQEKRPKVNPVKQGPEEMLDLSLLTKSEHWAYEKEWRLFQYKKGPGIYSFSPETLVGIIFGSKISDDDKVKIKQWVANNTIAPKIYEAYLSPTDFKILIPNLER